MSVKIPTRNYGQKLKSHRKDSSEEKSPYSPFKPSSLSSPYKGPQSELESSPALKQLMLSKKNNSRQVNLPALVPVPRSMSLKQVEIQRENQYILKRL